MSERYDVAVIGTGPAGLSAAITLKIRNKNVILFGSRRLSQKIEKAHEIQNYPGLPGITGQELAKKFTEHIDSMGIAITEEQITAVYGMGDYYSLLSQSNTMYEATTVILATGVFFGKPYPGEEEFLGRGVSYCATCDAPLYKDKCVAVIGGMKEAEKEAVFLSEIARRVYYIPLYKDEVTMEAPVEVIRQQPTAVEGGNKAEKLILKDRELEIDGVFVLRESLRPSSLVPGIEMDGSHPAVNRRMETNLPGCFACGDLVGAPYQYIKSAGEGNVAALSAVDYLAGASK
ncbi:MAG: NAD(P)/FAD-dependent oxidoreductase [Eubacterium sp.]|nr:NAD(P)/FAD-dependent oxidoreductase [Eubacterium sp.]